MKQVLTVFRFTFADALRRKSFILSSAILFVLITVLCLLPSLLGDGTPETGADMGAVSASDDVSADAGERPYKCYYIDEERLIAGGAEALSASFGDTSFPAASLADLAALRAEIADDGQVSLIVVTASDGLPFVSVTTKDFLTGISAEGVAKALTGRYVENALRDAGYDASAIRLARLNLPWSSDIAGNMNVGGYALGILLMMLIFFAIYFYGYGVAMSIATEKTSRVMETLVVSAKPARILVGKALAMGTLGLAQFAALLSYTALCFTLFIPEGFQLGGLPLTLSAFTVKSALLILAYFVLGYALYAMLNAVCGAGVSKVEDLNTAMMPVVFVALGAFYLGYFTAITPLSNKALERLAMYLPLSAPFVVPFRLLNGDVAGGDVAVSLGLLACAIALTTWVSIRLYNASVLHYGNRLKMRELLRMK